MAVRISRKSTDVVAVPLVEGRRVQRVGVQPVDGGEVALTGQTRVEAPEHLDDAQGTLADRSGDVTTRGDTAPMAVLQNRPRPRGC